LNFEKGEVGGQEIAASVLAAWKVCDKVLPLILTFSPMGRRNLRELGDRFVAFGSSQCPRFLFVSLF